MVGVLLSGECFGYSFHAGNTAAGKQVGKGGRGKAHGAHKLYDLQELPTDEEIDKQLAERAEKTKKTVEEIKAGTDVAALRRNEGIRKAADWVIDHSTIEEKVESK